MRRRRPARDGLAATAATAVAIAAGFVMELGHSPGRYELFVRDDGTWKRIPPVGAVLADVDGVPLTFGGWIPEEHVPSTAVALIRLQCRCGRVREEVVAVEVPPG